MNYFGCSECGYGSESVAVMERVWLRLSVCSYGKYTFAILLIMSNVAQNNNLCVA